MKRTSILTVAILGIAGPTLAQGYLSGGATLFAGAGSTLYSSGWTNYDPPTFDNTANQINGSHRISWDGTNPQGLVAQQNIGPTRFYQADIGGNGSPGECYRARVIASMSTSGQSNGWGTEQRCVDPPPPPPPSGGGSPYGWCDTPLVIDLEGDGLSLSGPDDPVRFDLTGDGEAEFITWTMAGGNDGFLALDLNGNGLIDSGRELFGSQTVLPLTGAVGGSHGFRPLADYDSKGLGGNENSLIDADDPVFSELRVWVDRNHNGRSEPGELSSLPAAGIRTVDYGDGFTGRRDEHGNVLWLEGEAWSSRGELKIYDVIFLYATPDADPRPDIRPQIEIREP